jgi:hypothetical protein
MTPRAGRRRTVAPRPLARPGTASTLEEGASAAAVETPGVAGTLGTGVLNKLTGATAITPSAEHDRWTPRRAFELVL